MPLFPRLSAALRLSALLVACVGFHVVPRSLAAQAKPMEILSFDGLTAQGQIWVETEYDPETGYSDGYTANTYRLVFTVRNNVAGPQGRYLDRSPLCAPICHPWSNSFGVDPTIMPANATRQVYSYIALPMTSSGTFQIGLTVTAATYANGYYVDATPWDTKLLSVTIVNGQASVASATSAPLVTPKASVETIPFSSAMSRSFAVKNTSASTATLTLSATCGTMSGCSVSKTSTTLASGATDDITVSFVSPSTASAANTIALIAAYSSGGTTVADTGRRPTVTPAIKPSVSPHSGTLIARPGTSTLQTFYLGTNQGLISFDAITPECSGWITSCSLQSAVESYGDGATLAVVSVGAPAVVGSAAYPTATLKLIGRLGIAADTSIMTVVLGNSAPSVTPRTNTLSEPANTVRSLAFTITNTGNLANWFTPSFACSGVTGCQASTTAPQMLNPGQSRTVSQSYRAPSIGQSGTARLIATQTGGGPIEADTALITTTGADVTAPTLALSGAPSEGSTITAGAQTVTLSACDADGVLQTPRVLVNGATVVPSFTSGSSPSCTTTKDATFSFVAAPGANTIDLSVSDGAGHTTPLVRRFTYDESTEVSPVVTPLITNYLRYGGQTWTDSFSIRNSGPLTVRYTLSANCLYSFPVCTASPSSILVGPGQTQTMLVNYQTPTSGAVAHIFPVVTYTAANGSQVIQNTVHETVWLDQVPPSITFRSPTPADGATVSEFPSIAIDWCDADGVLTATGVTIDGVPVASNYVSQTVSGCTSAGTSSWSTISLALGTHTVVATASDQSGHTSTASRTITLSLPAIADFQPLVTVRNAAAYLLPGTQTWAFAVRNVGIRPAQYQITPDCAQLTGQLGAAGCQVDRSTLALAPGAVDTIRVAFTLTALPGAAKTVGLTATYTDIVGRSATHTASISGQIPTLAQLYQPSIAPSSVVIPVAVNRITLLDLPITNLGIARATYRMNVSVTAPFAMRNVIDSIVVDPGQTAIYSLQPASPDSVGKRGTIAVTATYTAPNGAWVAASATRIVETTSGATNAGGTVKVIVSPDNAVVPVAQFIERTYSFVVTNAGTGAGSFAYTVHCAAAAGVGAASSVMCTDVTGQTPVLDAGQSYTVVAHFTGTTVDADGLVTVTATSSDGSSTDVGLVRTWLAPQGRIALTTRRANGENAIDRSACVTVAAGQDAVYQCGDLELAHALPATTTMNKTRAPTLVYNSRHAQGNAYIAADVAVQPGTPMQSLEFTLKVKDAGGGERIVTSRTVTWQAQWSTGEPHRFVVGFNAPNASLLPTGQTAGAVDYRLEARSLIEPNDVAVDEGTLIVIDRSASRFGRGWWLAGLEQLVVGPHDSRVWVAGDGSARVYKKQATGLWTVDPTVDRPDTLIAAGSGYRRLLANGAYVEFDFAGRHTSTRNTQGHITQFGWDATTNQLREIRLPVPSGSSLTRSYVFAYDPTSGRLSSVTAPSTALVRQVLFKSLGVTNAFAIDTIVDPDGKSVAFGFDPMKRVATRRNRAGYVTAFTYDDGGGLRTATLQMAGTGDDITHTFCAAETVGLTVAQSPCVDEVTPSTEVRTLYDGPRLPSDVIDQTSFYVDRFGAPMSIVNALGQATQIERRDNRWPLLATAVVSARQHRVEASYDSVGRLVKQTALNPYDDGRSAITEYRWNASPTLRLLDQIISPTFDTTKFGYYPNGDRAWQQDGRGDSTRVSFAYNADRQLNTSTAPGGQVTTYHFDAAGNIDSTRSPMGFASRTYRDAIGLDTLTETPTDSAQSPTLRTRIFTSYDAMSRPRVVTTVAAPTNYSAAGTLETVAGQTLTVEQSYDDEGNLTGVVRRDASNLNAATGWTYDAAGRRLTENSSGIPSRYQYDRAGNLRFHTTPRAITIEQTFDALNRVKTRTTPGQSFAQTTCHPGTWTGVCLGQPTPFPKFSASVDIPTDVALFDYDADGNMIRADNFGAQIRRTYYSGGALKADTLKPRRATDDGLTGDDLYIVAKTWLSFTYDLAGRRASLTTATLGGGPYTQSYSYVPKFGALETVNAPSGQTFRYRYDRLGQPYRFESPANVATWQYDDDGRVRTHTQTAVGLSHQESFSYDARGKSTTVTAQRSAAPASVTVNNAYDGMGALVMSATGSLSGTELEEWTVDALANALTYRRNRQSFATATGQTNTIDASSGRLDATDAIVPAVLTDGQQFTDSRRDYDNSGNVVWTATRHTVAQNGVLRSMDRDVYTMSWYGADEKLRAYQTASVDTVPGFLSAYEEYRYDALGRRVTLSSRSFPSCKVGPCLNVVDYYIWDGDQLLLESRRATNASGQFVTATQYVGDVMYVHGLELDAPLALLKDGEFVQPQRDWRGQFDGGIDASGQAVTQGVTWPGGNLSAYLSERAPAANIGWRGSLIQGMRDPSGLIYRRNRYYDPASGRFTQQDPIGLAGGMNLYGFAGGDPVNFSDPFGLWPWPELAGTGGAVLWGSGSLLGGLSLGGPAGWITIGGLALAVRLDHFAGSTGEPQLSTRAGADATSVVLERRSGRSLKREWEGMHGQPWPEGCVAHHICPLADGGKDNAANIEPKTPEDHVQGHKDNGDFKRWGARSKKDPPKKEPQQQP